jgi:oligopeptidase B
MTTAPDRRTLLQSSAAAAAMAALSGAGLAGCASGPAGLPQPHGHPMPASPGPMPPVAPKIPKRIEQLGRVRVDDYAWMKDDNWQKVMTDPTVLRADIRTHLEAENAYTKAMLAPTDALQTTLFEEMKGRVKEDDSSVPDPDGPWEYYTRFAIGAQHPIHARKPRGQAGPESVMIDVDAMAKGKAFFQVGAAGHTSDHKYYLYAADDQGSEVYKVYVRDLSTGKDLPEPIEPVAYGSFAVSPDSQHIFWILRDDNGRPAKVMRRPIRGGKKDDVVVYDEPDDGFFLGVGVSEDDQFIIISAGNQETSESHIIPAATPTAAPTLFHKREVGVLYSLTPWNERWYILTNADKAVDFKIMSTDLAKTARTQWTDFVPYKPGNYIEGLGAFKNHLVRLERVNALPRIVIRDRAGVEHEIAQSEEAYDLSLDGGYEYDTSTVRFIYTSPSTPRQTFDYDMTTRARTLRKTQEIPSGHDASRYLVKRLQARAEDGALVPITVLMLKGTKLDGSAPLLLYGYGSYGISQDATFSIRNLSLVNRGWIWATAHIRGGADKGRGWFEDGRKFKKKNTFTDFIACAEHLTANGYGAKGKIVAYGGSAGGLLVGAVTNMRPDLWAGVIAAVPFVDVINTMSDVTLPLTPPEWPEWGNPIEDAAAYDYMLSYSPYDQVGAKAYPAVLATGGLSDPRVTYWEPAKWAAKLRANTTSNRPILLKINMEAGHGGASGRFDFLKEIAFDYAFAIRAIGGGEGGSF